MNNGLITGRIVKPPIRFSNFNYYVTEIQINFVHITGYFACAIGVAEGKVSKDIFELYCQGDYILIEGEYLVLESQQESTQLIIYILDVQPAHLIM